MKRFPAYDPPEYVDWSPDADIVADFANRIDAESERKTAVEGLGTDGKLDLYRGLLRTRLHDIMLTRWVRQGVISKAWLSTGEEAATVGPVHALDRNRDYTAPMIRNAGALCEMGLPVADMLRGYLGTADAPARGRDGHVGAFERRVLPPISNIGNIPPVTNGIALALRQSGGDAVAITWIGDGSTKTGATHEALNFAAVLKLPVIFIIQNNQVALGTPVSTNHLPGHFDDLHEGYGTAGWSFDGNNVLDAYAATSIAVQRCRAGEGPVILSTSTFRMGGHATHDEREARELLPEELFRYWGQRDPIGLYEEYLKRDCVSSDTLETVEGEIVEEVDRAGDKALASRESNDPVGSTAADGVYAG